MQTVKKPKPLSIGFYFKHKSLSLGHSVLITIGLPTHFNHEPPEEMDGPPGGIALTTFLQALGKEGSMVVDQKALTLHRKLVEDAVEQGEQ